MTDLAQLEDAPLVWPTGELVDVASIEAYAEDARIVATPLEDNTIRTPDWVIGELAAVSRHASRMVLVILNAETFKRRAATKLERARAKARWENRNRPPSQISARVVMATEAEKDEYDAAVAAFEYSRRVGNLLKDYTGRVQSIGKQVELAMRGGA